MAQRLGGVDAGAGWLVLPVAVWTAFATLIVLGQARISGHTGGG